MPYQTFQKKKAKPRGGTIGERQSVDSELARIAGLERVPSRDPVHHLIEHSRNMFDMLGRVNAEKMADPERKDSDAVKGELNEAGVSAKGKKPEDDTASGASGKKEAEGKEGAQGETEGVMPDRDFYKRFSEIAFNKGKLMLAVGEGGGKTMLASCIRQTIDQSPLSDNRQSEVRKKGATQMRIPDSRAKLSYHRHTRSALNLVVDTAQNLTRTLTVLERMASGEVDDRLGLPGIDTAYRMYPFLNMKPDKERLESYREEHRALPEGSKKRAVEYGINRLSTIISQKERMRVDFLFRLRKILADSRRAEELFSQPAIEQEIVAELMEAADDADDGIGNRDKG